MWNYEQDRAGVSRLRRPQFVRPQHGGGLAGKAPAKDSPIGYKVRLNFGHADDDLHRPPDGDYKNVEEAYGSYLAPVGKGLQIDVGKFVTNAGAEVIEAKDNWNYSRSLLFQLAIPVYHAGIRLTYSPNDKVTLMGGVVNGWNNVNDNNTGKTVMASITLKPTGALSIIENYIGGPEQAGNSSDLRTSVGYGRELHRQPDGQPDGQLRLRPRHGRRRRQHVAGRRGLREDPGQQVGGRRPARRVSQRPERFWSTGTPQNITEGTLTLEVKAADNFLWRIEYRGDFSNTASFVDSTGLKKKNQQSLGFGFLYSFSSKS